MNGLEDRVFFCGEHLSVYPAWILGAMTSAGLAVQNMTDIHDLSFLAYRELESGDDKYLGNRIPDLDFEDIFPTVLKE